MKEKYDATDNLILSELRNNCKRPVRELAKKLRIHPNTLLQRIKKLEKETVILSYKPWINAPSLGYPNIALLMLKTNLKKEEERKEFISHLKAMTKVLHLSITMGKYDYFMVIVYKHHVDLYKLIKDIKLIKKDYIMDYDLLQVVEEPKYDDVLGLVLE